MDDDTHTTRKPQQPRYRRVAEQAIAISLQPRDLLLLKLVYEFPYSTAAQLSRLMPVGTINTQLRTYHDERRLARLSESRRPKVRREILRRLQQLFHAKGGAYVQRHKITNNSPILYTIAMRAVDLLAAEFDLDTAALARSARNRDPGEKYLRHTLLRTGMRFAFTVSVAARPDVKIAFWCKDGSIKIPLTYQTDDGRLVEDIVIPDDFIGLSCNGKIEPLLIESDKRKDYPRVRAKMVAYLHLWRQIKSGTASLPRAPAHVLREIRRTGQLRSRKPVYVLAGQPVQHFRVLWVAKGVERKEGLRRLAHDLEGPQGDAAGLFWFSDESQYHDAPERILGPVWQKARNDVWRPLVHEKTP
jgi:hypothetical protein